MPMKRAVLRSAVFDLLFFLLVGLECLICLPFLLLPRRYFMGVVHGFVRTVYFLEKYVLGLDYEVQGLENLPKDGSFIVAAKHQSPYETMKLHMLLKDPAVILKKELLSIPLWGLYLKKSDVIAIDRSTPDAAIQSIQEGAKRMMAQGRPIVIFPQGTRVSVDQTPADKPYKVGVARIQEATGLPIVPLALNTGLFWPRSGLLKSQGTVIFKFLEPIPAGGERKELLKTLESRIEGETLSLINEAREKSADDRGWKRARLAGILAVLAVLFGAYSFMWFSTAERLRTEYPEFVYSLAPMRQAIAPPSITGYPGKIRLSSPSLLLENAEGRINIVDLRASGWPVPFLPIDIETGPVEVRNIGWQSPLKFDRMEARFLLQNETLTFLSGALIQGVFTAGLTGSLDLRQKPVPEPDLVLELSGHHAFLSSLEEIGALKSRPALFAGTVLAAMSDEEGRVRVPVTQKGGTLYAGPLPLATIPQSKEDPAKKAAEGTLRRSRPHPEAVTPRAP